MTHDQMANLGGTLNMIMLLAENDNDMKRVGECLHEIFSPGYRDGPKREILVVEDLPFLLSEKLGIG
jgi:hypothetical protein